MHSFFPLYFAKFQSTSETNALNFLQILSLKYQILMVLVLSHNSLHIYTKDNFYHRIQKEYILDIIILLIEKMYLWTSLQEECCSEPIYLATFEQGRIFSWKRSWELAHLPRRPMDLHWVTAIESALSQIAPT